MINGVASVVVRDTTLKIARGGNILNYNDKLLVMKDWVEDNLSEIDEACVYLDISLEDVLKCFPDKLVKSYNKTFPPDVDETLEAEDEQEAWQGYRISDEE